MEPASVLRERPAPGDWHRQEQGIEPRVIEALTEVAAGGNKGPVAKFFRALFGRELRSVGPVLTQLLIEFWPSESPVHNQKLGYAAFSRSSHTGLKNFATGPPEFATSPEYLAGGTRSGRPS